MNLKSYNLSHRDQEDVRSAKGEDEITLYNTKKRRIIYSSCRVGPTRNLCWVASPLKVVFVMSSHTKTIVSAIVCLSRLSFFFPFCSPRLLPLKCFMRLLLLSPSHLFHQDDSDDEPPAVRRPHGHSDALEYMDLSCEEGEETASSEGHSEVPQSFLSSFHLGGQSSSFIQNSNCCVFFAFVYRKTTWTAVSWIPPMTRKSGRATAPGIVGIAFCLFASLDKNP